MDAMNRATDRLVERKFAFFHLDNIKSPNGIFSLTDNGIEIRRLLKLYFDAANVGEKPLAAEDYVAFVQVLLHTEPVTSPLNTCPK